MMPNMPPVVLWCKEAVISVTSPKRISKLGSEQHFNSIIKVKSILVEVSFDEIPSIPTKYVHLRQIKLNGILQMSQNISTGGFCSTIMKQPEGI